MSKIIVGAGLSGLIAACRFKDATIIEAGAPAETHKALLRFREEGVAKLTGIPFKRVRVHKEVYMEDHSRSECSIRAANMYALKVSGALIDRSIKDLRPVDRFVAPDDFYPELADKMHGRIEYNTQFDASFLKSLDGRPVISTAPMFANLDAAGVVLEDLPTKHMATGFERQAIEVLRFPLVGNADVYQTVYFPERDIQMYRASITGNVLIIERLKRLSPEYAMHQTTDCSGDLHIALHALGLSQSDVCLRGLVRVDQKNGKIVDMPAEARRAILYRLTTEHNIFSLGRFATWRNILLDDVVNDLEVISSLIDASAYVRLRHIVKNK